jgi:hypothetical protein
MYVFIKSKPALMCWRGSRGLRVGQVGKAQGPVHMPTISTEKLQNKYYSLFCSLRSKGVIFFG